MVDNIFRTLAVIALAIVIYSGFLMEADRKLYGTKITMLDGQVVYANRHILWDNTKGDNYHTVNGVIIPQSAIKSFEYFRKESE